MLYLIIVLYYLLSVYFAILVVNVYEGVNKLYMDMGRKVVTALEFVKCLKE